MQEHITNKRMQASKKISKCLCCMSITGPFVDLSNCNHTDFLKSFFKYYEIFSTLACRTCHGHLINITKFKDQIETCYSMLTDHLENKTELKYKTNRYREFTRSEPITVALTDDHAASSPNVQTLYSYCLSVEPSVTTTEVVFVKLEHVSDDESCPESSGPTSIEVEIVKQEDAEPVKLNENDTPATDEVIVKIETDSVEECEIEQETKDDPNDSNWDVPIVSSDTDFACPKCNKQFMSKQALASHYQVCYPKKPNYKCKLCSFKSNSFYDVDRHFKTHHKMVDPLVDVCGYKWFTTNQSSVDAPSSSDMHITKPFVKDKPFPCTVCSFKSHSKRVLLNHIAKVHKTAKPYACAFCDFMTNRIMSVTQHIRNCHSDFKPFTCRICGHGSLSKTAVVMHMRSHLTVDPQHPYEMQCNCCGLTRNSHGFMLRHMDSHMRHVPYACHVCGVACKDLRDQHKHLRSHKDYKSYACAVCKYKTVCGSDLKNHVLRHRHAKRRLKDD